MTNKIMVPELTESIAFVSDIHGVYENLIAATELRPDIRHWFCAGDIVDMFMQPHYNLPTVRLMIKLRMPSVRGNHDYHVTKKFLNIFEVESQGYLRELPLYLDILFAELKIRIYHATPQSLDHFIPDKADEATYHSHFGGINADIIVLGHTHRHYAKQYAGKRFINPGSLGFPNQKPTFCVLDKTGEVQFIFLNQQNS